MAEHREDRIARADLSSTREGAGSTPAVTLPDNVRRLFGVSVRSGPDTFIEVGEGGQPTGRTYYLAEMQDGSLQWIFTDGTTKPAPSWRKVWIEDGLRYGTVKEVQR